MKEKFLILVLVCSIIGLLLFIFFEKSNKPDPSKDEKLLRDSLLILQRRIDSSKVLQNKLEKSYDSLKNIETPIIYRTRDKIKFILSDASPDELDSIIRANWKYKSRYR
jgi:hypothetical protein